MTENIQGLSKKGLDIPESLKESLKNVEQGFKAQLGFNFGLKEFLAKKSCFDLLFKGFKYQSEITFLRKIKKVLIEAFKDAKKNGNKVAEVVEMIGPLFSINSDVKVDLTHSDLDAILNHEKLQKLNFDLNKLLMNMDSYNESQNIKDIKTKNFALEDLGMSIEKLEKSGIRMDGDSNCSSTYATFSMYNALIELFNYATEDFQLDFSICVGGIFSGDGAIRGKGFGQLASLLLRASTYKNRESELKIIHQDFLLANKLFNRYKDLYGELPEY